VQDAGQRELAAIRLIQQDLRRKLEAVDARLARLEGPTSPGTLPPETGAASASHAIPEASKKDWRAPESRVMEPPSTGESDLEPPPVARSASVRPPALPLPPALPKLQPQAASSRSGRGAEKPTDPPESFEVRVGRVWLVRVGILILLTGLVFLGNLAWHEVISKFGPVGKLGLIILAGAGLCGFGMWVGRKGGAMAGYARVVLGGGLATLYYACYAAHFVEPLRVITSALLGGLILLGFSAALLWLSDRLKSQTVASATILLGFYTASINPLADFSLISNLLLTMVAVVLFLRRKWVSVSFLTLVGCYVSFAFWRFHATGSLGWIRVEPGWGFTNSFIFPAAYWLIFSLATFVAGPQGFTRSGRPVFMTLNNGAFFGLTAPLVAGTYPGSLWIYTLVFGGVLIGLSLLAAQREPEEKAFDGTYLTQGLGLLILACVFRLSGYQLALMLALQSAAFMGLSRFRHPIVFQLFSGLAAILAVGWSMKGLVGDATHSTFTAGAVSLVLYGVAWTFKRQRGLLAVPGLSWRAGGFVALATLLALVLVVERLQGAVAIYVLVGLAVALAFLPLAARLPELSLAGQFFGISSAVGWLELANRQDALPWVAVLAGAVAILHWWQWDRFSVLERPVSISLQTLNASVAVAVTLIWQFDRFEGGWQSFAVACSAVGFLAYGLMTRALPLAIVGQANSLGLILLLPAGFLRKDPCLLTLAATALFASQPLLLDWLNSRIPDSQKTFCARYQTLLRSVSVLFGFLAVHAYVAPEWRFAILAAAASLMVVRAAFSVRANEFLIYAAVWAGAGYLGFLMAQMRGASPNPGDFLGFGLMLACAEAARRLPTRFAAFSVPARCVVIALGIAGIWLLLGRFVAASQGGILLTISWSVLAFAVLGAGFLLHERTYRLSGLVILTASVGRIFLVDVWQLETLPRILSFLVLGGVLLALGFLYNRFADAIRRWL